MADAGIAAGNLRIPVDAEVSTLVPYRGARGTFRYISVADVLHQAFRQRDLKGRIIWWELCAWIDGHARHQTPVGEVSAR